MKKEEELKELIEKICRIYQESVQIEGKDMHGNKFAKDMVIFPTFSFMYNLTLAILSAGYIKKSEIECDEVELENFLEREWNHLFSPEDNYSGRFALAHSIATHLKDIIK